MILGLVLWVCGLTGDANASSIHNIIVGQIVSSRQVMVDQEPFLSPELYKWARKKGAFPLVSSILSEDYDLAPAKIPDVGPVANPIPSSMLLLGTGLAGLAWVRNKFKKV